MTKNEFKEALADLVRNGAAGHSFDSLSAEYVSNAVGEMMIATLHAASVAKRARRAVTLDSDV
jgi:hypothetical protein